MRKVGRHLLLALLVLGGCARSAPSPQEQAREASAAPDTKDIGRAAARISDQEATAGDASIKHVNGQQVIKAGDIELTQPDD